MVTVPAETPVTTPVEDTVAIAVFEELQGVVGFGVPEPVNVFGSPTQAIKVPVIVGKALTVKVSDLVQPRLFL